MENVGKSEQTLKEDVADPQMTFQELEEHIRVCHVELEEMQKVFLQQSGQVTQRQQQASELNDAIQKAKNDQDVLEEEVALIDKQIQQIGEALVPMGKKYEIVPYSCEDTERYQSYIMLDNLDMELERVAEDFKEIVGVLNRVNKEQINAYPGTSLSELLSIIIEWLQWIDVQTKVLSKKLDQIEKDFKLKNQHQLS